MSKQVLEIVGPQAKHGHQVVSVFLLISLDLKTGAGRLLYAASLPFTGGQSVWFAAR